VSPTDPPAIRPLATWTEFEAAVALQEATWGVGFRERVPPSLLLVAQRTGGIAAGAFDGDEIIGFVFGVTGFVAGRPVHWSDMLAVRPDRRDRGIGFALKRFQRERMLEAGVERIVWTMDPLESRNAYFNFNKLGACADTYERDLYGRSDSPLHLGIGTDRLVVTWSISAPRVERCLAGSIGWTEERVARLPPLNELRSDELGPLPIGRAAAPDTAIRPLATQSHAASQTPAARLAVPADIQTLKKQAPDRARAWREHVRHALEGCFVAGWSVTGLVRQGEVGWYVLERRE